MARPLGEKEFIIERRRLVMERKVKGESIDKIVAWLQVNMPDFACSRSTVASDVKEALRLSIEETKLNTSEYRILLINRIENVLSGEEFQSKLDKGDLWTIDRFEKLIDKLAKLTGAYMPTRIQNEVTGQVTVSLTDDERATRVQQIIEAARHRKELADMHRQEIKLLEDGHENQVQYRERSGDDEGSQESG